MSDSGNGSSPLCSKSADLPSVSTSNQEVNISDTSINNLTIVNNPRQFSQPSESECQQTKPSSVTRVRQPNDNLTETQIFDDVRRKIQKQEETSVILQCHGIPGSGKSQLIRTMAEEFPYSNYDSEDNPIVKWHIQCKDSGHDLCQELEKLAERLLQNSFINPETHRRVVDNLGLPEARELISVLAKIKTPVLIMIEDPNEKDQKLLHSLCRNLKSLEKKISGLFHIYISSRESTPILECSENISCFKIEKVKGFNEEEAIKYLNKGILKPNKDAAKQIFKRFSGLPFGLHAAKAYCKIASIEYLDYLALVDDVHYDIIKEERNATKKEYGKNAKHVFQALVFPFLPSEDNDIAAELAWKVLCCLSYFHYDRIPRFALEQCCHVLREVVVKNPGIKNKVEIGTLITKLQLYGMCTETDEGEITFHEVVSNAFRLNQHSMLADFSPLKKAIEVMSSLVSKDMRKKDHSTKMRKLRRHLQSLLKHTEKDYRIFDGKGDDALLLKALTSHLHETAAAIMLHESPSFRKESGTHFEKALKQIWPEMIDYTEFDKNRSEETIAQKIVELSIQQSFKLPLDFTVQYASKLELSFKDDEQELKFLESKCKMKGLFLEVKQVLDEKGPTEVLVRKLQSCGLFLSDDKYRSIFYAERFAFILHSWSRLVLYSDPEEVDELGEKCVWMSNLCNSVSAVCKKSCGVSLLAEHIAKTGGWIPILLKLKRSDMFQDALEICENAITKDPESADMYENGMLKEVYGPSHTSSLVALLKNIVRINAKMHRTVSSKDVEKADKRCKELFKLSQKNVKTISACLMCLIYCAKYYAAKEDFDEALRCFKVYFSLDEQCKPRFNVSCWATYNYARAVFVYKNRSPNDVKRAFEKCGNMLGKKEVMSKSLKEKLDDYLNHLASLDDQQ